MAPLFKAGSRSDANNYRPISILSNLNKIVEKVIFSRLVSFLNKYGILNNFQFGFRKGFSTSLALAEFYEKVLLSLDKGQAICTILIDLSKAFDSVSRKILLLKLYRYRVRGNLYKLIQSYLEDRSQYVCYDSTISEKVNVNIGVPQGSILGPIPFLLLINDLKT